MASNDRVSALSDADLRKAFMDAGYKPGPCIPSTRKTLESIYRKMQAGENVSKFFTQTQRQAAPLSATANGEEEEQAVEQGRYSNVGLGPRTPYGGSSPIATSTPTPSSQYGGASSVTSSGGFGQTSSGKPGGFDPRLIQPREAVKSTYTPVSTGADLRQRRTVPGSASNVDDANRAASGSSNTPMVLLVVVLMIFAAIAYYFLFTTRSSSSFDDGDIGIPKISGDAPADGI